MIEHFQDSFLLGTLSKVSFFKLFFYSGFELMVGVCLLEVCWQVILLLNFSVLGLYVLL